MGRQQTHPVIAEAIKLFGSQIRLAKTIGSSQSTISRMLLCEIPVSAEIAAAIDRVTTGAIPRWKLRPDLWDPPSAMMCAGDLFNSQPEAVAP